VTTVIQRESLHRSVKPAWLQASTAVRRYGSRETYRTRSWRDKN